MTVGPRSRWEKNERRLIEWPCPDWMIDPSLVGWLTLFWLRDLATSGWMIDSLLIGRFGHLWLDDNPPQVGCLTLSLDDCPLSGWLVDPLIGWLSHLRLDYVSEVSHLRRQISHPIFHHFPVFLEWKGKRVEACLICCVIYIGFMSTLIVLWSAPSNP